MSDRRGSHLVTSRTFQTWSWVSTHISAGVSIVVMGKVNTLAGGNTLSSHTDLSRPTRGSTSLLQEAKWALGVTGISFHSAPLLSFTVSTSYKFGCPCPMAAGLPVGDVGIGIHPDTGAVGVQPSVVSEGGQLSVGRYWIW